jgi:hypothetical protein
VGNSVRGFFPRPHRCLSAGEARILREDDCSDYDQWSLGVTMKADPTNREDWPRQHRWLALRLNEFIRVFKPFLTQSRLAAAGGQNQRFMMCCWLRVILIVTLTGANSRHGHPALNPGGRTARSRSNHTQETAAPPFRACPQRSRQRSSGPRKCLPGEGSAVFPTPFEVWEAWLSWVKLIMNGVIEAHRAI